jgi:hypothetical protein
MQLPLTEEVEFQLERQGPPLTLTCRVVSAPARSDEGSSHAYALLSRQARQLHQVGHGCTVRPEVFKKAADGALEVSRADADTLLEELDCLVMQARFVPAFVNGVAQGYKAFSFKPDSAYRVLGLQPGDVVKAVNGHPLTSREQVVAVR